MKSWQRMTSKRTALFRRSESGVATVEMAVIAPLLLLLFLGVADFGRAFYTAITLSHAARAGAQFGSFSLAKSGNTSGMNQAATQEAQNIGAIGVTSQRFCQCNGGASVNCVTGRCSAYGPPQVFVRVTATKTFNTAISYPGIPSTMNLSRTAVMRVQ